MPTDDVRDGIVRKHKVTMVEVHPEFNAYNVTISQTIYFNLSTTVSLHVSFSDFIGNSRGSYFPKHFYYNFGVQHGRPLPVVVGQSIGV